MPGVADAAANTASRLARMLALTKGCITYGLGESCHSRSVDSDLVNDSVVRQQTQTPNGASIGGPHQGLEGLACLLCGSSEEELGEVWWDLTVPNHATLCGHKGWEDRTTADGFVHHQVVQRYHLLGERHGCTVRE